jgi:hypothetical protein
MKIRNRIFAMPVAASEMRPKPNASNIPIGFVTLAG